MIDTAFPITAFGVLLAALSMQCVSARLRGSGLARTGLIG